MKNSRLKVLHILGSLDRGGAETWLMHVLRHLDRTQFQMDFVVHTTDHGAYEDEAKSLGAQVLPCVGVTRPWEYRRQFLRVLAEHGPYQAVHSHVHHFSGLTLWLAQQAGVPVRIAHSHLDTAAVDRQASWPRRAYLAGMDWLMQRAATLGMAASLPAAGSLFGPDWRKDPRWRVFYCAIDLKPFKTRPASFAALKASLGLPAEAFVVGHVGRFFEQKNHRFLIDIAAEAARRDPQVYFLLVGDGPLRPEIEQRVAAAGLAGRVIFTGVRQDVPQLMQMMDVFLLPSLYEGLALVTIEAQAAGMPMLLSDTITPETQIVAGLPHFMALTQPATAWAEKLLSLRAAPLPVSREQALATVLDSPFNIEVSVKDLEQVYRGDAHLGS